MISDAVKLRVYNRALRLLGSRRLATITEDREPRRVMDDVWADGAAVRLALERAEWNFAMRAREISYDAGVEPTFGFSRAFEKPSDLRRLAGMSSEAMFINPLTNRDVMEEGGWWFARFDTLYVRYVSDDADYGFDSDNWTEHFIDYLGGYHAFEACERLTSSNSKREAAKALMDEAKLFARGHDAIGEGVKIPPSGSWVRARHSPRRGE